MRLTRSETEAEPPGTLHVASVMDRAVEALEREPVQGLTEAAFIVGTLSGIILGAGWLYWVRRWRLL